MDKYFKIQKLIELQKERKEKIEKVLQEVLFFLPKYELEFQLQEKINYQNMAVASEKISFILKLKIKDKSSVKFVVNQNKQKILEEYSKIFGLDFLIID